MSEPGKPENGQGQGSLPTLTAAEFLEVLGWKFGYSAVGLTVFIVVMPEVFGADYSVHAPLYALAAVVLHAVSLIPSRDPKPEGDKAMPFLIVVAMLLAAFSWALDVEREREGLWWLGATASVMSVVTLGAIGYAAIRLVQEVEARRERPPTFDLDKDSEEEQ